MNTFEWSIGHEFVLAPTEFCRGAEDSIASRMVDVFNLPRRAHEGRSARLPERFLATAAVVRSVQGTDFGFAKARAHALKISERQSRCRFPWPIGRFERCTRSVGVMYFIVFETSLMRGPKAAGLCVENGFGIDSSSS
jgi:hypothetical protein